MSRVPKLAEPRPWPRKQVLGLMQAILLRRHDLYAIEDVPSRAYIHPNGFKKIPLGLHLPSNARLFIHVWTDNFTDTDIHNHRWHFASRVIHGALINRIYELEGNYGPSSSELISCRYTPATDGTTYELRPAYDAPVAAIQGTIVKLDRMGAYSQRAEVFHRATSTKDTVTLMSRSLPLGPSACMLLPAGDSRLSTLRNTSQGMLEVLSQKRVRAEIERVLDLCSAVDGESRVQEQ